MNAGGDSDLCIDLQSDSLDDDLVPLPNSTHTYPVAAAPGARGRADAALLRLCRVMTVITIRAGNAHEPPLTAAQIRVLAMLAASGRPLILTEVAECLGASASSASRLCSRLVRDQLVARADGPGNEIRLSLTPTGIAAFTAVNEDRLDQLRGLLGALPASEEKTVLASAEQLAVATPDTSYW